MLHVIHSLHKLYIYSSAPSQYNYSVLYGTRFFFLTHTFYLLASPYMAKLETNPVHRLLYDCVILCHCTLAAALYFEQSTYDELMEFKQIQTRAQPEESLKRNHRQVCATMVMF